MRRATRASSCQMQSDPAPIRGHRRSVGRDAAGPGRDTCASALPKLQLSAQRGSYHRAMRTARTTPDARRPRPGWAVITFVLAAFFTLGLVASVRSIVFDHAWWNLPGAVFRLALTYWVGIAAWRSIWAPEGPAAGHRRATPRGRTR